MSCRKGCLIGLDLGTSYIKGILLSTNGSVLAREKANNVYDMGENGRIEFDAEDFFLHVAGVIRSLTASIPSGDEVKGIGMASASGNTLLVDEDGKPLMQAFSWMDTSVTGEIEQTFGKLAAEDVYKVVGWPLLKMFPLAHLAWLRQHKPLLLDKANRVCMTTDYINYRLTGSWGIDPSTATTFYLQDQTARKWNIPFLKALGISEEKLPPIFPSGSVLGGVTGDAYRNTGLITGTPVVLGAFDHPCAARGAGVLGEGSMLLSCGTSWVGFYPVGCREAILSQGMTVDPFLQPEGPWGAMFSLPAIATKVDRLLCNWISDQPDRYREFDRLAAEAKPGAGGLLINMLQEDEGELRQYNKHEIARAIMEGTAFLLKIRMDSLASKRIPAHTVTMVGGPSETHPWPQIVCDVLGLALDTVYGSCAGAVGAAVLAGIGAGLYADVHEAQKLLSSEHTSRVPDRELHGFYQDIFRKFRDKFPEG